MIVFNGATGGIGRHLGPRLVASGRPHLVLETRLEHSADLTAELSSLPQGASGTPIALVHLAAMVSVPRCEADPELARSVNVDWTASYIRAFIDWSLRRGYRPSVVYVSTGHVYAAPEPGVRVRETDAVFPRSVYAKTKLEAEGALGEMATQLEVQLTVARVFGLVAPAQPPHYVLPALIARVQHADVDGIPGLDNVRDYLDARDVARHLEDLADWSVRSSPGVMVVNVCSGVGIRIRDLVDMIIDTVYEGDGERAESVRRSISGRPGRPTDVTWLVGCPGRQQHLTGAAPCQISLGETIRDAVAVS